MGRIRRVVAIALVTACAVVASGRAQVDEHGPDGPWLAERGRIGTTSFPVDDAPLMIACRVDDRPEGRWFEYDLWQPGQAQVSEVLSSWQQVQFLLRLDRERVLISRNPRGQVFVLDLVAAEWSPVFPERDHTVFLRATSSALWYLRPDPDADRADMVWTKHGFRRARQGVLLTQDLVAQSPPRAVLEGPVQRLLGWCGDRALVQSSSEAGLVWVDADGGQEPVEMQDAVDEGESEVSPGGRWLAVAENSLSSPRGLHRLSVYDLEAGCRAWQTDIDVQVSLFSSSTPRLEMGWVAESTLRASESFVGDDGLSGGFRFVDWSFPDAERIAEYVYSDQLGLEHQRPRPQPIDVPILAEIRSEGPFTRTPEGLLWPSGETAVAHDEGGWGVELCSDQDHAVVSGFWRAPLIGLQVSSEERRVLSPLAYLEAGWVEESPRIDRGK